MSKLDRLYWIHARRERLVKDVLKKFPEYPRPTIEWRSFETEAEAKLPDLKKEIEKHNAKVNRERDKLIKRNKEIRRLLVAKIRYGSEADCETIVEKHINDDLPDDSWVEIK